MDIPGKWMTVNIRFAPHPTRLNKKTGRNPPGFPGDLFHSLQGLRAGIVKIIHYNYFISRIQKLHTGMASDIAGSAGH